ncbi:cellulose-binding domain-containing protein [Lentzea sp. NBRC 102530]|uniref:cellulose-binding domain-containing protein n=1 Tax=Lentzea sp. NBRC 102530 TaxID=3032201 RepID=UPI002555297D|nr:cellulose-binding domain-containing protein [Lentzea sp. NBRC 102530]
MVLLVCACTTESPSRPVSAPVQLQVPTLINDSRGEVSATVRAVVDGRTIELDGGERVRISQLAQPADCWAPGARAFAEKWLLAKAVRVSAMTPGEVNLRLEDGTDYALLAVREGILRAQDAAGSLVEAELAAARDDRGLWGAPCNGMDATPSSTATTTTSTAPSQQQPDPSQQAVTTTTPPPPIVTTQPPPPPCAVSYRADNQWQGGFQAQITIRNTGRTPINGWSLSWTFADGQTVRDMWNASASQRGSAVTATAADHNRAIQPGAEASLGFLGSSRGRNTSPDSFTLNGAACTTS